VGLDHPVRVQMLRRPVMLMPVFARRAAREQG
jgi:hypothetical protein